MMNLNGRISDYQLFLFTVHFYDLIGNIIKLNEKTTACGIGGAGSLERIFEYDPLYRILSGTGRENSPTITPIWDDRYRSTDNNTTTGYTQNYSYDKLGNIQVLQHLGNNNFTRNFNYTAGNNQLQSIGMGMNNTAFAYDACGNQISETTSRHFEWDFGNRLRSFYVQTGTSEPTQYAQYLYDAGGTRVKKLVRTAGGGYTSRVYIDDVFEYKTDGTDEQNLLHIMDDQARIAMVRLGDTFGDTTPAIKYNIDDYLRNSTLLLETSGALINKEEYYPFGETSFGSYAKKRYRFTGKERDSESGLYYYGARYYSPWTCRFISVDQLAAKYPNTSAYAYAFNNPIMFNDPTGMIAKPVSEGPTDNIVINDYLSVAKDTARSIGSNKVKFGISPKTGTLYTDDGSGLVQNVEEATVIGNRDYRTSGDQDVTINDAYDEDTRSISRKGADVGATGISMINSFFRAIGSPNAIPGFNQALTFAKVDPNKGLLNGTYPMDYLTIPGASMIGRDLVKQWDESHFQREMQNAELNWDSMKDFAKKYNTNKNTAIIFVYAAMDIHNTFDALNYKVPTTAIYSTPEEAKAALGFVPRVVYYKFIEPKNTSLTVHPMFKVNFK